MIRYKEHWLSKPKGEPRRGRFARCSLIVAALCLANISGFEKAHSVSAPKITHYKQYAFIELNDLDQYYCLEELWFKESRWNPKADNPRSTAYGIPQLLKLKEQNPFRQIDIGLRYIEHRYSGCACKALQHHKIKGWY